MARREKEEAPESAPAILSDGLGQNTARCLGTLSGSMKQQHGINGDSHEEEGTLILGDEKVVEAPSDVHGRVADWSPIPGWSLILEGSAQRISAGEMSDSRSSRGVT